MLFPEDELKRRAYVARRWMGFYPTYEEANLGEPVPRSVLLSIMKAAAAADPIDQAELKARDYEGMIAGEQLKVLAAIAQSQSKREHRVEAGRKTDRKEPSFSLPGARRPPTSERSLTNESRTALSAG
jgi:hypothetical protein